MKKRLIGVTFAVLLTMSMLSGTAFAARHTGHGNENPGKPSCYELLDHFEPGGAAWEHVHTYYPGCIAIL